MDEMYFGDINPSSSRSNRRRSSNSNYLESRTTTSEDFVDNYHQQVSSSNFYRLNTKAKGSYEIPHQPEQQQQHITQHQDYAENFGNHINDNEMMGVLNQSINAISQPGPHHHQQHINHQHQQPRSTRAALEPEGDYSTAEAPRETVTQWNQELSPNSHIYSFNGTSSDFSNITSNNSSNATSNTPSSINNHNHKNSSINKIHNSTAPNNIAYEYNNTTIVDSDDAKRSHKGKFIHMIKGETQEEEEVSTSTSTSKHIKNFINNEVEEDNLQEDDPNVPPWQTSGSQFPLPSRRQQGQDVRWCNSQKRYLSSFYQQWSNIKINMSTASSNQSCIAQPPPPTTTSTSSLSLHNTKIEPGRSRPHMGSISNIQTEQIDKNILSKTRKTLMKDQAREKFYRAIENDKIQIKNDTSITGRYNTKRKYKPFGFVPSTEKACQEEIYEVIKPSQYFDTDDHKNTPNQQHYQSWDPKTMQYSPQPYNMFQPLCNGAKFPMTPGLTNAAATTRAALLSYMTKGSNTSPPDTRSSANRMKRASFSTRKRSSSLGLNLGIFDNEDKDHLQFDNNNNSSGNRISSNNSTMDIDGGFERRYSSFIPSAQSSSAFESMNELDLLPISSGGTNNNALSASSSSNRYTPFGSNSHSDDYAVQNNLTADTSSMKTGSNLWKLTDQNTSYSARPSSSSNKHRTKKQKQRSQEYSKRRKTTSPIPKRKKKNRDEASSSNKRKSSPSVRRSGRKRQRRSFDDDSSYDS